MAFLEQIKILETKVKAAVDCIAALKEENLRLKTENAAHSQAIIELQTSLTVFKKEKEEVEESIKEILTQLDRLEDYAQGQADIDELPRSQRSDSVVTTTEKPVDRVVENNSEDPVPVEGTKIINESAPQILTEALVDEQEGGDMSGDVKEELPSDNSGEEGRELDIF